MPGGAAPPQTPAGAAPVTQSSTTAPRPAPATLATTGLGVPGATPATLYFGQLDAVLARLPGLTFHVAADYRAAHPQQCALTVVFRQVVGSSAAVYAQGLGGGWSGAEYAPDQSVSTDSGTVHQQVIIPPQAAAPGTTWYGSGRLVVDGVNHDSDQYRLSLTQVTGSAQTWQVGPATTVTCTL
jgi:hypothetical protein